MYLVNGVVREFSYLSHDFHLLWGGWVTELKMLLVFTKAEDFWPFLTHTLGALILTAICVMPWVLGFVCQISGWYRFLNLLERKLSHV